MANTAKRVLPKGPSRAASKDAAQPAFWRAMSLHIVDTTASTGKPIDFDLEPRWRWLKVLGMLALVPIMFWLGLLTGG